MDITTLIAVVLTISIYTFILFRDNPLYRTAESLFIGVSLGNMIVMGIRAIISDALIPISEGRVAFLIPVVLGVVLLVTHFRTETRWISRFPMSIIIGVGTALSMRGWTHARLYDPAVGTILPVFGLDAMTAFDNLLIIIQVCAILLYFVFGTEQKGWLGYAATIGRISMLTMFGVSFGYIAMGRLSSITGRFRFLLDALGII